MGQNFLTRPNDSGDITGNFFKSFLAYALRSARDDDASRGPDGRDWCVRREVAVVVEGEGEEDWRLDGDVVVAEEVVVVEEMGT